MASKKFFMIIYYIIHSYWSSDDITLTVTNAKKKKKKKKTESLEEDPFLSMASDGHELKMKVLKLKEWKLMHQCDNMGIGLPPAYDTDEEHS